MAQPVGHLGRDFKPMRGGMAQSVDRSVHFSHEKPANAHEIRLFYRCERFVGNGQKLLSHTTATNLISTDIKTK